MAIIAPVRGFGARAAVVHSLACIYKSIKHLFLGSRLAYHPGCKEWPDSGEGVMSSTSLELLQAMPIFGAISDGTLKFLLERAKDVRVKKGDFFFRENDQGSSMFVLEAGRVAVLKSWVGQTKDLAYLDMGDCFGEMALIEMCPRSASIQATEDCRAIELSIDSLHELYQHDLEQFTVIQMNISREVCRRLRRADDLLFQAQMQARAQDPNYRFHSG